jgi:hypothetical protein
MNTNQNKIRKGLTGKIIAKTCNIKFKKKSYPTECNILLSEDIKIAANIINRNCRPSGRTTFKE